MDLERLKNDSQRIYALEEDIGNDLAEITSPRSSGAARTAALKRVVVLIGSACLQSSSQASASRNVDLDQLMQLQDGFEYNVPSKLLPWISLASPTLENLANLSKNFEAGADGSDSNKNDCYCALTELATQMILSLSIIQGVALNHQRSKRWLGRTKSLEILVDLLLASRNVPLSIFGSTTQSGSSKQSGTPSNLTSTILDTMLCILVDSTPALRAFEQCNGVQAIVKILKRAGSPREVRMKCLEFLYFYLLDETKPSTATASSAESTFVDLVPTVPNTPSQSRTSNSSYAPNRPSPKARSEYGSSTFSFPHSSYSGPSSFTSTSSTTSAASASSISTTSSTTTAPGSTECSPKKSSSTDSRTPPTPRTPAVKGLSSKTPLGPLRTPAPKASHRVPRSEGKQLFPPSISGGQTRSFMMLNKDVEFVPQSPQKMQAFGRDNIDHANAAPSPSVGVSVGTVAGMGGRRTRTHSRTRSAFALGAVSTRISSRGSSRERGHSRARSVGRTEPDSSHEPTRTTEEKKELLGTMLGNVDALVEGVRKAGIWGLG
ncbi:cell division control protein 14, SIN component-domain-containing protein [Lentinula aff. detonsa]|uniref:Cell division control protein 14, SIN component-domain-containing protein n=1 Tax=Lentinula aff. detonsa TaxID=2804958 RepID=A0AA38KSP7_9AGAR|nr:cell division control protein 14, SIN component-domain-containing protein [Lentinula aff. detonsa]